jgi:hypothetical protein
MKFGDYIHPQYWTICLIFLFVNCFALFSPADTTLGTINVFLKAERRLMASLGGHGGTSQGNPRFQLGGKPQYSHVLRSATCVPLAPLSLDAGPSHPRAPMSLMLGAAVLGGGSSPSGRSPVPWCNGSHQLPTWIGKVIVIRVSLQRVPRGHANSNRCTLYAMFPHHFITRLALEA